MLHKKQFARSAALSAALALVVLAAGCGGGNSNKNHAQIANFQFGQSNFKDINPNRGLIGTASANSLNSPSNAATNGSMFYIADTNNNRVLGFTSIPTSSNAAANFAIGQDDLTSNAPGFTSSPLRLASPTKVSISPDGLKLLVVDKSNNRVLIWNTLPTANTAPDIILGVTGTAVDGATLKAPRGATFAPTATYQNRVIVADSGNNRVLVFNNPTTGSTADFVLGQRDVVPTPASGGIGAATGNSANCPQPTGSIKIACDNSNSQVTSDTLANPGDVASDGFQLVIADTGNGRVLYFPTMPEATGTPASNVIGQTTMTQKSNTGGGATGFNTPNSVWQDAAYIYVADKGNNRVLAFLPPSSDGNSAVSVYGQGDFVHLTANDDNQNNAIDKDNNGKPEASDRTLSSPSGMVTLGSGTASLVYVLDAGNNRMMVFNTF